MELRPSNGLPKTYAREQTFNDAGQKSASGKFAEIDTDEYLKADKSQGGFATSSISDRNAFACWSR
jgi:hypothetical protein